MKLMHSTAVLAVLTAGFIAGCDKPQPSSGLQLQKARIEAADVIYAGGDIVTVNDQQPNVEALAVKGGKIVAVGARAEIERLHEGAATRVIDLAGKTLVPGFLDAHSHYVSSLAVANHVNVYAARGSGQGSKGSLEGWKLADLVSLDQNPLKVDPIKIKDIKVVETIEERKTIYQRAN